MTTSLYCDRCSAELVPGQGNFYVVKIEALADPTPPVFEEEDLGRDPRKEIERLLDEAQKLSERELLEQVYRSETVCLCLPCYTQWIENPIARPEE